MVKPPPAWMLRQRGASRRRGAYLVAAIDRAHNGRVATARRLIEAAAGAGADAVKFAFDSRGDVRGFPLAAWRDLRRDARQRGVAFVAAPYDESALGMARKLRPDVYQVDAPVLPDLALIARIGREKRPMLIVAGACTTATIGRALGAAGSAPVVALHAVMSSALRPADARLQLVPWIAARFRTPAGYFGSEPGIGWALVAATLGAVAIEKPLTLDRSLAGAAHGGALEPEELAALAGALRDLSAALRPVHDRRLLAEEMPAVERDARSLVARRPLRRGRALTSADLETRSEPGGVSPSLADWLEGRRLRYDVEAGEPITFGVVDLE
jgi:sialic acid synthase SpsE